MLCFSKALGILGKESASQPKTDTMTKPEYLRQTAERMTTAERRQWFQTCNDEAKDEGITWMRFSVDDANNPKIALVEGWNVQPEEEGPIRFQLTYATEPD